jgi:hypothetical protein
MKCVLDVPRRQSASTEGASHKMIVDKLPHHYTDHTIGRVHLIHLPCSLCRPFLCNANQGQLFISILNGMPAGPPGIGSKESATVRRAAAELETGLGPRGRPATGFNGGATMQCNQRQVRCCPLGGADWRGWCKCQVISKFRRRAWRVGRTVARRAAEPKHRRLRSNSESVIGSCLKVIPPECGRYRFLSPQT